MIKKDSSGKWILYSKDGKKVLGEFETEEAAKKREKQINYFKNLKEIMKDKK